jgi:hypothetical protein
VHDQQIAGRSPATTFPLDTIDTLLPCSEDDFIFGIPPPARSALPGTLASGLDMTHKNEPHRSIMGTMIIGQWLWAKAAENACRPLSVSQHPWDPASDFSRLLRELDRWESLLPPRQTWNPFTLKVMRGQSMDLVSTRHTPWDILYSNTFRGTCPLVHSIVSETSSYDGHIYRGSRTCRLGLTCRWMAADIYPDGRTAPGKDAPPGFWRDMAREMTENCKLPCPVA